MLECETLPPGRINCGDTGLHSMPTVREQIKAREASCRTRFLTWTWSAHPRSALSRAGSSKPDARAAIIVGINPGQADEDECRFLVERTKLLIHTPL